MSSSLPICTTVPANANYSECFAQKVAALEPDCFIVAGDIGHPLRLFQRGLQLFEELSCPRYVLSGNHDLYRAELDSRHLWEQALPAVAVSEGFRWLEEECFVAGEVGICGTMGWYDYSSAAGHLDLDHHEYRLLKPLVNHDADYIDWPWSDRAMARYLLRRFTGRLETLHAQDHVRNVLVITHMPIFAPAVPDYADSEFWSLLQAYLGNFTLGDLVAQYPKVSHVISGHIHKPGRWTIDTATGPIEYHVVGSGADAPRSVVLDL